MIITCLVVLGSAVFAIFCWLGTRSGTGGPWGLLGVYREACLMILDGLPGAGKSYYASRVATEWLANGHPVVTNLKLNSLPFDPLATWGEYKLLDGEEFRPVGTGEYRKEVITSVKGRKEVLVEVMRLPALEVVDQVKLRNQGKHVLLLVDECHDFFGEGAAEKKPLEMSSWIATHRHRNVSVLLTTQHYSQIHAAIRKRCQEFRHVENLVKHPELGKFLWMFGRNIHVAYSCPNKGGAPDPKKELRTAVEHFKVRKRHAQHYQSAQFNSAENGRLVINGASSAWRRYLASFVVLCVVVRMVSAGVASFGSFGGKPRAQAAKLLPVVPDPVVESKVVLDSCEQHDGWVELTCRRPKSSELVMLPVVGGNLEDWLDRVGQSIDVSSSTLSTIGAYQPGLKVRVKL